MSAMLAYYHAVPLKATIEAYARLHSHLDPRVVDHHVAQLMGFQDAQSMRACLETHENPHHVHN